MKDEAKMVAIDDLCQSTLGITPRRYRQLATQGIVPKVLKGKVPAKEAIKAVLSYQRNRLKAGTQDADYQEARRLREQYRAALLKIELDKRTSQLVDAEKVRQAAAAMSKAVRERMLKIPGEISESLAAETDEVAMVEIMTAALKRAINELCEDISNGKKFAR